MQSETKMAKQLTINLPIKFTCSEDNKVKLSNKKRNLELHQLDTEKRKHKARKTKNMSLCDPEFIQLCHTFAELTKMSELIIKHPKNEQLLNCLLEKFSLHIQKLEVFEQTLRQD